LPFERLVPPTLALAVAGLWSIITKGPIAALPKKYRILLRSLVGLLPLTGVVALLSLEDTNVLDEIEQHRFLGQNGYTLLRVLADFDGDGHLAYFGGADCADDNPKRYPGALEVPENGIDEDCDGQDLKASTLGLNVQQRYTISDKISTRLPIILITVDAFSSRHMGILGYKRRLTPNMDHLAKSSAFFPNCFSQGPSTRLSFPALFTSRYDSQIDRELKGKHPYPIEESEQLLAEIIKKANYRTSAIIPDKYFGHRKWESITRGFERLIDEPIRKRSKKSHNSKQVTDAALKELDVPGDKNLFLWIHYFDTHSPFTQPDSITRYGDSRQDIYDAELALVDQEVGRLLEGIRKRLGDDVIIVLAGDHGIAFDPIRNKTRNFGHDLLSVTLNVPLMFKAPFITPHRYDHVVSTMDITPSLVNLARIRTSDTPQFEGVSLIPELVYGRKSRPGLMLHQIYINERRWSDRDPLKWISLRTDQYNLILNRLTGITKLYNWRKDPLEKKDLTKDPSLKEALKLLNSQLSFYYARIAKDTRTNFKNTPVVF